MADPHSHNIYGHVEEAATRLGTIFEKFRLENPHELALDLIERFGCVGSILFSKDSSLESTIGSRPELLEIIKSIRGVMLAAMECEVSARPILSDGNCLVGYLRATMAYEPRELFRVLFLNSELRLIQDEVLTAGSIKEALVYPREILRRSFELGACSIVLVHNHPSGDPNPSSGDVDITRKVAALTSQVDISVEDHIIVTRRGWSSLRQLGLLG